MLVLYNLLQHGEEISPSEIPATPDCEIDLRSIVKVGHLSSYAIKEFFRTVSRDPRWSPSKNAHVSLSHTINIATLRMLFVIVGVHSNVSVWARGEGNVVGSYIDVSSYSFLGKEIVRDFNQKGE